MIIRGEARTRSVWVGDVFLNPKRSQKVWNHSPDGFNWGYEGSGPAQLALAILLQVGLDQRTALRLYQDFKREHIATLPQGEGFTLYLDVDAWVHEQLAPKEAAMDDVMEPPDPTQQPLTDPPTESTPQGDGDSTPTLIPDEDDRADDSDK